MDEFEGRLRRRLARLEAAAPTGEALAIAGRPLRHRPRRGRQLALLAAAVVALLLVGTVATLSAPRPLSPHEEAALLAQEAALLAEADEVAIIVTEATGDRCLHVADLPTIIRPALDAAGFEGWRFRLDDHVKEARCVGFGVLHETRELLVMPSMSAPVARALDDVRARMLTECLDRDAAVALVAEVIHAAGVPDPTVVVGGALVVPVDGADAYLEHLEAGCAVYSNAQWDEVGRYTWYIAAR